MLALIAATTCAAVLVIAPVASVARLTVMALPVTVTASGALFAPGFTSWAVRLLPPRWPHALRGQHHGAVAVGGREAAVLPTGRLPASKVT